MPFPTNQGKSKTHRKVISLVILCLVSAFIGVFTALANPVIGALWARGVLDTVNRCAAPLVLIVAGAISWLIYALAKTHPNSSWKNGWNYLKFGWKVYAVTSLALLLFVGAVAVTNTIRYR